MRTASEGSFVAIEEIELGLHPAAARDLAYELQTAAFERHLQVVCTSHSREFIEALPRRARVLLQRHGREVTATAGPTATLAFGSISGRFERDVIVFCEDDFAEALIQRALQLTERKRVHIVPVGGKSDLVRQALFHRKCGHHQTVLIVWDGDVAPSEVQRYMGEADPPFAYARLPGEEPPERVVLNALVGSGRARAAFASALSESEAEMSILLDSWTLLDDPHQIVRRAGLDLSISPSEARSAMLQAYFDAVDPSSLDVVKAVRAALDGRD